MRANSNNANLERSSCHRKGNRSVKGTPWQTARIEFEIKIENRNNATGEVIMLGAPRFAYK